MSSYLLSIFTRSTNGLPLPQYLTAFGGHQHASSPEAGNGSATPLTEVAFRPVPSIGGGASIGQWFPAKSKTSTDTAESSALRPDAGSPRVWTPFSHTAQQPRGGGSGLGGKNFSESSSSASSENLDSSAIRGGHSSEFLLHGSMPRGLRICLVLWSSKA